MNVGPDLGNLYCIIYRTDLFPVLHFSPQLLNVKIVAFQPIKIQQAFSEKSILGTLQKGAVFLQAELHIPFFQLLKEISL